MAEELMSVPFNNLKPVLDVEGEAITKAFARVYNSGKFILGPEVDLFERTLATVTRWEHAVGVANGTDAIQLALETLCPRPGDVLVPANSAPATVCAIVQSGHNPVYCEVDVLGLIDVHKLGYFLTPSTVAIVAVDLYGQPCDYELLREFADAKSLMLISDGAQSYGSWSNAPGRAHIQTLSFYPTKALGALGDGGAILTNDGGVKSELKARRFYGIYDRSELKQEFMGCNSRLDELQAAILNERGSVAEKWAEARRSVARFYHSWLNPRLLRRTYDKRQNYHIFSIHVQDRDSVREFLRARGVETAVHYPTPAHRQHPTANVYRELPITEAFCRSTLSLPIWAGMDQEQAAQVVDVVNMVKQ